MRRIIKLSFYGLAIGLILLIAGYFIAGALVRRKVDTILQQLPPSLHITYTSLDVGIISGSLVIHGLVVKIAPGADSQHFHRMVANRIAVQGIRLWTLLSSKKLVAGRLEVDGCVAELDHYLREKNIPLPRVELPGAELPFTGAVIGQLEVRDIRVEEHKGEKKLAFLRGTVTVDSVVVGGGADPGNVHIGAIQLSAAEASYSLPGAHEVVRLGGLKLDSRKQRLTVDTLRVLPTLDKIEMGRREGHQVDWVAASSEGLLVEGLDMAALLQRRFIASAISIRRNTISIFRDRRLPPKPGNKPMPAEMLKRLPLTVRIGSVKIGSTSFAYEEFPKKGDQTGTLTIARLKGTISPLINRPVAGDPAYLTMKMEGSLMGSGSVGATTRIPLREGDVYVVEGAFHELDLTSLNPSAENLGKLHIESGMLNSLAFWFTMDGEKATGKIVGEYHDLVADKLRENSPEKKVDKIKSFFLKKLIIPRNKDRSLSESKRTGKVDYKRDPSRYFSYYLLHSLLVGVKSSFSLGFLLPG